MPGVTITTAVRTGATNTGTAPAATFFVAGETERGIDTSAVLVTSLEDYQTKFGAHVTGHYVWYTLKTFFEEGGISAYVARTTAEDADYASIAMLCNTTDPGITLTAVGAGAWANTGLEVIVDNTGTAFDLVVNYADATVYSATFSSIAEAVTAINASTVAQYYFTAALTAGADGTDLLKDMAASNFTGGADGAIAKEDFVNALAHFTEDLGAGAVAIPGVATGTGDSVLYFGMQEHCAFFNRVALCGFASTATLTQAGSASEAYAGTEHHEFLAFYHPWVTIPVGNTTVAVPAEGYVAGARARNHNQAGPWKAYAGVASEASFVTGTTIAVSRTVGDSLEAARVNPIRVINGRVRVYGARSHSTNTEQWRFITARETINYIVVETNKRLEDLVFSTIDGRATLFANIIGACRSVLEPVRIAGGLYEGFSADGRRIDYGYTIKCDASINPLTQLESGTVKARIGVRCASVGDKIEVELIKSNLTTALA